MKTAPSLQAVLFDLDGTLLPMDQDTFARAYFAGLAKTAASRGYEPERLIKTILAGTAAMVKNTSEKTNGEVFWDTYLAAYGEEARADIPMFDAYYERGFDAVSAVCGYDPAVAPLIRSLRAAGVRVILATNPIFPPVATEHRLQWAGLEPTDFEYITTYDNAKRCKPNPDYYRELLEKLSLDPAACLMVGNDVTEDMIAARLGLSVYLVTDCLINKSGEDIDRYPHGDRAAMGRYLRERFGL